MADRWHRKSWF